MSHLDIIIITSTLLFASSFGVYAVIRVINRHTRPPVNTLVRSGDIELVDYIEPTQGHQLPLDLLQPLSPIQPYSSQLLQPLSPIQPYSSQLIQPLSPIQPYSTQLISPINELNSNFIIYSDRSGRLSYQTIDRFIVNSCLENTINLDFIFPFLLILILILVLILILRNKF